MLDILVPVLGRAHNVAPLVENIRESTTVDHTILFLCSRGDEEQIKACQNSGALWEVMGFRAGTGDYSRKINHGFRSTASEWVFMGADDIQFTPGWDTSALKAAGTKFGVVSTNDMANAGVRRGQFGTHCLIRRRYVTELGGTGDIAPGVVLHEGYDHNFVDRELSHVAQNRGKFVFAKDSVVKHFHPLWKTAPDDETYRKSLRNFRADQQLFCARAHLWNYTGLSAPERRLAA